MPQPSPTADAPRSLAAAEAVHLSPGPAEQRPRKAGFTACYHRPMVIPPEGIHMRWVFSTWGKCPDCGSEDWCSDGVSGRIQYRVCRNAHRWKVTAIAHEVDRGDITTRIELM